jgi:small-conductance mechanosensitive channel
MEEELRGLIENPVFTRAIITLIGIVIIIIGVRAVHATVVIRIPDVNNRYRGRKFVTFIGYIAAIIFIAAVYQDTLGGLSVTLGIAGAGIAFALQEVITSIAGWIAVSFGDFYSPGDRVQLGGIKGDVIDISLLRTTLMEIGEWVQYDQYTGRMVRVSNSFVFKEPVINYSAGFPFIWDEVKIPVRHGSDHRLTRSILQKVAYELTGRYTKEARTAWAKMKKRFLIEKASLEPTVFLIANDNWLEFSVRYIVDLKRRRTVKDRFFTRILDEIEKSSGKISIASTTFQIVEPPTLDIRLTKDSSKRMKG